MDDPQPLVAPTVKDWALILLGAALFAWGTIEPAFYVAKRWPGWL